MEDHSNETLQFQNSRDDDLYARDRLLGGRSLQLDDYAKDWILNHVDCFDRHARLNESIKVVFLYGYSGHGRVDEVWDEVGQAIGNLQALKKLCICPNYDEDRNEVGPTAALEILARILSHVRQKIKVTINDIGYWDAEQCRLFAQAIHGHPTITSFEVGKYFPYESLDTLYSALATLPALESMCLWGSQRRPPRLDDEAALAHRQSLTELLRVPSLRSVCFDRFDFTPALCQATANALMEGTATITDLEFRYCSFSALECAIMMANGLSRFTSVSHIIVVSSRDQALFDVLATALPSNSTLRRLELRWQGSDYNAHLSPVLLALCKNIGVKDVSLDGFGSMDEPLCTSMKDGLGMNTTLENLESSPVRLTNDNYDLWCGALSFLRTNKVLKSLMVTLDDNVTESLAAAFRTDIAAMLHENASLESLAIKAKEYVALISALQHNTTLKSINLQHHRRIRRLTDVEDKHMAVFLRKNYALERLPDINHQGGDVGSILRLNEAGRRYLVQDGSSILKGVEVLSVVSNEINCVFLHLLENPRLCDRSAVETASDSAQGSRKLISPANHNGKREQDQALKEDK
jgi:hypothetical protein